VEGLAMTTYIAMLRGINVSGQKRIKMEDLEQMFTVLKLEQVKTYVQSGNVIFKSPESNVLRLTKTIEEKIKEVFHFSVPVLIRTADELQKVVTNNPWGPDQGIEAAYLYVTFLSGIPVQGDQTTDQEMTDKTDKYRIAGKEVYLFCPNGYAKTRFSNQFFERKFGIAATTRNWKTINTLLRMAA
jgi:uncharacterized protein (DUF1697 family)